MCKVLKRKNQAFLPASVLYDYVKVSRFEARKDDWIDLVIENIDMKQIVPDEMIIEMADNLKLIKDHTLS